MEARVQQFKEHIRTLSASEKDSLLLDFYAQNLSLNDKVCHFEQMTHQMSSDYTSQTSQVLELKGKLADLEKKYRHICELNIFLTGKVYGTSSEQFRGLLTSGSAKQEDPISEDADPEKEPETNTPQAPEKQKRTAVTDPAEKKPRKPRSGIDLSKLERVPSYDFDPDELDRLSDGEDWSIAFWHVKQTVEYVPGFHYLKAVYTPVLSVGLEHRMVYVPTKNVLLGHSLVSPSLIAEILFY